MTKPYQRGPNSWQVRLSRTGPDGLLHKVDRFFETRAEAQAFIDITVGRIAGDEIVDKRAERATSLRALIERYRDDVTMLKEDPKGRSQELSLIRKWLGVEWVDYSVLAIEPAMLAEWRDEQIADGAAATTISNPLGLLSKIFRIAQTEWRVRVNNPVAGLARPKADPAREAFLRPEEEAILLEACGNGPWQLPWATRVALSTAMRASEIRHLNWRYIDLKNATILLPKTKNGTKRDVPLVLPGALEVFEDIVKSAERRSDGYIFGDPEKLGSEGGYTATMLTAAFADAVEHASKGDATFKSLNDDLRFHDLRHVAITRLAPYHRDALDLSKTTGHKTLTVLARYYNEHPHDRSARLRRNAGTARVLP